MATVYDDEETQLGKHDDLGVPPHVRDAEIKKLEAVYQDKLATNHSPTTSDLAMQEGLSGQLNHESDNKSSKTLTPAGLGLTESMPSSGSGATDQVGKGFAAAGSETALAKRAAQKIKTTVGNHKKSFIGAGLTGIALTFIIIGFTFIAADALINIENTLLHEADKIAETFEEVGDRSMMSVLVCRAIPSSCKTNPIDPNEPKGPAEEEPADPTAAGQEAASAGEGLSEDLDDFSFASPTVENALAKEDIQVDTTTVDGTTEATGLVDTTTGEPITADEITTDPNIAGRFEAAENEWGASMENNYEPDLEADAGVSFEGLPDTPDDDTQQSIETDITQGDDISPTTAEVGENGTNADELDEIKTGSAQLNKALDATTEAAAQPGTTGGEAVAAGVKAFDISPANALLLSALATTACTIKDSVSAAALSRVPQIISLLIRHGNLLITLADQLKTGNLTSPQVSTIMNDLSGQSGQTDSDGVADEASLPFSSSAAWFRASGLPVTNTTNPAGGNYTPDISNANLPSTNGASNIVFALDNLISDATLSSLICPILTSGFGFFAQTAFGLIQFSSEIAECVGTITEACVGGIAQQSAITAIGVAGIEALNHIILPDVIKYFTPVGINGSEDAVQNLNDSDAGLNLSFNDYARHIGAQPVSNSTAISLSNQANADLVAYNNSQSWTYRAFAISDPESLTSRLLAEMPLNLTASLYGVAHYFTNIPTVLANDFSSIFLHTVFAATSTADQYPWQAYNTYEYALTAPQVNAYDMVTDETWLNSPVTYTFTIGGCAKYNKARTICLISTSKTETVSVNRIAALGNPDNSNGTPVAPDSDTNQNDLLHCFNDSYTTLIEANAGTNGVDPICGNIGQLSYNGASGSDPPTPVLPTIPDIATIYCTAMQKLNSDVNIGNCVGYLEGTSQVTSGTNDLGHFEEYMLYTHEASDFISLSTDQ
jgi:hypothetical protein